MIGKLRNNQPDAIEEPIAQILEQMRTLDPTTQEYTKMVVMLERLTEIQAKKARPKVTPDTMAIIAGNLLGILVIVAYEQKHVMTSKAISNVLRPKSSVASN